MATIITAVATCCCCKGTWMLEMLQKPNENAPKYGIKTVACWKVKTNSQWRSVLGMASRIHYLNGLTVFSLSATLNLGAISLSCF